MIADNAKTILSFLASWPGAIGLMAVGCFLLWLEIKKVQARIAESHAVAVTPDIPKDGEAMQPETLIGLFKTNQALIAPYINQTVSMTGTLFETYPDGGLKEQADSLVLKRASGATVIAHLASAHRGRVWNMRNNSEVTVSGQIVLIDADSVTIDDADIVKVKPAPERPSYY